MKIGELKYKDGKAVVSTECNSCGCSNDVPIQDCTIKLMKMCGCNDMLVAHNYKEHCLKNSWFSCFGAQKCDLCGEKRVLCWYDGCSPSGVNVINPSSQINFWPNYDYPGHEINICRFCMPDNSNEASRKEFLIKLFDAMSKVEKDNWLWKIKSKIA